MLQKSSSIIHLRQFQAPVETTDNLVNRTKTMLMSIKHHLIPIRNLFGHHPPTISLPVLYEVFTFKI